MSNPWDERAELYRTSVTHSTGDDLDAVVELCNPHAGVKVLDVATGGGHVARRLQEQGAEVVTLDPSPGMRADVVAPAEDIPFADGSFDVAVSRIAAHHFADLGRAFGELVRVSSRVVVIEDMLYRTEEEQEGGEAARSDASPLALDRGMERAVYVGRRRHVGERLHRPQGQKVSELVA